MSAIEVRQVENGFVLVTYTDDECIERIAATDKDMIDLVTEFFFGGVLDIAGAPSPEQPSYKHPEKDIFNLSEDEAKPETNESDPITPAADLSPGGIINPVVDHEDNELTGERTYIYADGTRSGPCSAPASWSPNGQAQE